MSLSLLSSTEWPVTLDTSALAICLSRAAGPDMVACFAGLDGGQ
jgi:hypothetical protein